MALRPIKGSFDECLKHYRKYGNDHSFKRMAAFNVTKSEPTLRRWFVDTVPNGVYRIRLQQYLADCGYQIAELLEAPEEIRLACQLLSYDLASEDEIAAGFGIAEHRWSRLPNLLTTGSMSKERLEKGRAYIAPLRAILAEVNEGRRLALVGTTALKPSVAGAAEAEKLQPPATPVMQTSSAPPVHEIKDHEAVIQATAAMLTSVFPLLQLVNSDQYTPEERKALREKLGFFGAMSISTELNRLCSERAREQFSKEGNPK